MNNTEYAINQFMEFDLIRKASEMSDADFD